MKTLSNLQNVSLPPLSVFLSALAAFVLRALPYRKYLGREGEFLFGGGPGSYGHLRRISLGIRAFPALPPAGGAGEVVFACR